MAPSGRQATPGERFTAIVTALGAVLIPFTALGGDAHVLPQANAAPPPSPAPVGAGGQLPANPQLSDQLFGDLNDHERLRTGAGPLAEVPPGKLGIPGVALDAYLAADKKLAQSQPSCGLRWPVVAAIGRIESGHARSGQVDAHGTTVRPILGPELSGGPGLAAIVDTDDGRLDGDRTWDRAVGPMQFIPSTWQRYGVDGNGDSVASPHNLYDAALATGRYLCAADTDLRDRRELAEAIFRYNPSESYVRTVLLWADQYAAGVIPLPRNAPPGDVPLAALADAATPLGGGPLPAPPPPPAPAPQPPPQPLPPPPAPPGPTPQPAPRPAPAPPPPSPAPPPPPPPSSSTAPPPPPPTSSAPSSSPPPPSSSSAPPNNP